MSASRSASDLLTSRWCFSDSCTAVETTRFSITQLPDVKARSRTRTTHTTQKSYAKTREQHNKQQTTHSLVRADTRRTLAVQAAEERRNASSSAVSDRSLRAGLPVHTSPSGTLTPRPTTAPASTKAFLPTTAPGSTCAPMPMRAPLSTVADTTRAPGAAQVVGNSKRQHTLHQTSAQGASTATDSDTYTRRRRRQEQQPRPRHRCEPRLERSCCCRSSPTRPRLQRHHDDTVDGRATHDGTSGAA
jgi:hypothetical protein